MLPLITSLLLAAAPVNVQIYTESFCPCSGTFHAEYQTHILPLVESISVLNRSWDGQAKNGSVHCFHGDRECSANTLQACAAHLSGEDYKKWLNYTVCINGKCTDMGCPDQYTVASEVSLLREEKCAREVGLDWTALKTCWTGDLGKQLLLADAAFDVAMDEEYGTHGLPVVVVNGKRISHYWDCDSYLGDYQKRLVKEICDAYTGDDKPAAC